MVHDLAFVLMGVPFFLACAIGKGTTNGPFHEDLPNATSDALIVLVCVCVCLCTEGHVYQPLLS